jgi:CheY-like chemotaxis protein
VAKVRVFVVEDHPATARGLKLFLERSGYEVAVAVDIQSAMAAAETTKFDILLCDLNLPDGTGWDLMERLRKLGPVRGIAFSAYDEAAHIDRSKEAGFLEHVVKGSSPEALVELIERITGGATASI